MLEFEGGELEDLDGLDDLRRELHAKLGSLLEESFHSHLHGGGLLGADLVSAIERVAQDGVA